MTRVWWCGIVMGLAAACGGPPDSLGLIYLDGRATTPRGDTLLAMTTAFAPGVLVYHHRTGMLDTLAADDLTRPGQVEFVGDRWYVSDVRDGRPAIAVLTPTGAVERRFDLSGRVAVAHQFAVLPDGRVVVEAPDQRLVVLGDPDSTFALVEPGTRPSLLAGVGGGVMHAVPNLHLTLYNAFGNVRWRVEWPWADTAYLTDIAVDRNGRVHVIAGVPSDSTFIVYTLGREDGAVIRWSEPGPYATFTVERSGAFRPDSAVAWLD